MKLLLCTKILKTLIEIRQKIIVAVGKLKRKIEKFCPENLIFFKFCTFGEHRPYVLKKINASVCTLVLILLVHGLALLVEV